MINSFVPTIAEQTSRGMYVTDLLSKLTNDRIVLLNGPIDNTTATVITAQLLYLESQDPAEEISLYINSSGGSVSDGLAIYDTMQHIKCNVNTICVGVAASMAAFLVSGGTKGKRYMLPNAEMMIHQPLGGTSGQASDIEICAQHILKVKEKINSIMATNCSKTVEEIEAATDRDKWLSAEEALAFGLIDKIL